MRKFSLAVLVIVALIAMLCLVRWASAETKMGASWIYGKDSVLFEGWQSPYCENTVNRISIHVETNEILPENWDKWFLGVEGLYSRHKADEKPKGKYGLGHDAGFIDYGLNLTIKRQMFDDLFYVGGLVGMSYWLNRDHSMHDLGDSHFLGTWGGFIGKDWTIQKGWSIKSEIRISHSSDPFRSNDKGKNYASTVLGLAYTF